MIKLTKEVNAVINELEKNGFEAYAYGKCVRESFLGEKPLDWDLATNARLDKLKELFPEAETINKDREIIRLTYNENTDEDMIIIDVLPYGTAVEDKNIKFYDDIESQLKEESFVLNSMADNPNRKFYDTYDARGDIKARIIKTIGEPKEVFKKTPVKMFEAVELAAELGFDIDNDVYEGIVENVDLLDDDSLGYVRRSLERIIVSEHAGLGLNVLADTGLLGTVVGKEIYKGMRPSNRSDYIGLCEGIDKTKKVSDRRLALFYYCFSPKKAHEAIDRLDYSEKTNDRLHDAIQSQIKINFLGTFGEFKHYLCEKGWDRYNYLNNVSKAQRIVYDYQATKIESRQYYEAEIKKTGDPVFPEDLVVDANDVLEAGYAATKERADELLRLVVEKTHVKPNKNNRDDLLKELKKLSKSKFAVATRRIHWIK